MSQLKVAYVRGEMGDIADQENHCYDSKLVSLEQALATIRPGSRVYLGTGCAAPRNLLAGLEGMQPGPPDLEFVSFVTTSVLPLKTDACQTRYRHRTFWALMSVAEYDLIVIGGGPAGEKGAAQAAYFGKRVALVERSPTLGGAVANASIPFKALRETASDCWRASTPRLRQRR